MKNNNANFSTLLNSLKFFDSQENHATINLSLLEKECGELKKITFETIYRMKQKPAQAYLLRTSRQLTIYANLLAPNCVEATKDELNYVAALVIISLIKDLKELMPEYFELSQHLPLLMAHQECLTLVKHLETLPQNSSMLASLIIMVKKCLMLTKRKINYHQLAVLRRLISGIEKLLEGENENNMVAIFELLISQNINAPEIYLYCTREIIQRKDQLKEYSEVSHELSLMKKSFSQLIQVSSPFMESLPDLKTSILSFIDAENEYLLSLEKIVNDLEQNGIIERDLKVSFSVRQLAFFIHLQVECGIILEERPKRIREYVTAHYSTRETEKISENSFKNAYYASSAEDVSKVVIKLSQMLARAQQKY